MDKKGFTLVELIGVIIILALLGFLVVPAVNNAVKNSQIEMYNNQLTTIKEAAKIWGANNISELPDTEGGTRILKVSDLKHAGLLQVDLKDPRYKNTKISDDLTVTIKKVGNQYQYTVDE